MGHYSSFILRLWVEPGEGWRSGLIQHVSTRSKRRFSSIEELLEFITQHANQEELSIPFLLDGDSAGGDPPEPDLNLQSQGKEMPDAE